MSCEELLARIKLRGHWKTIIRPLRYESERIPSLSTATRLVAESQVRFRGWYFPHIEGGRHGRAPSARANSIEAYTEWSDVKEYWRLHQSGQFVHLSAFGEDWGEADKTPIRAGHL